MHVLLAVLLFPPCRRSYSIPEKYSKAGIRIILVLLLPTLLLWGKFARWSSGQHARPLTVGSNPTIFGKKNRQYHRLEVESQALRRPINAVTEPSPPSCWSLSSEPPSNA